MNKNTGNHAMEKCYQEDLIFSFSQWELTQAQEEALNFFSHLWVAWLTELLESEQENLLALAIYQNLSQNSQMYGENITEH